jgi:sugar lactone lactonase YvrE
MKKTLFCIMATGKICSGAWLALSLICLNLFTLPAVAQNNAAAYTWTTLAGLATFGSADGVGSAARFAYPMGVAVDSAGNVYVADDYNYTIRRITPAGVVSTIAGFANGPGSADGVGNAARFAYPMGVAVDSAGNVYVADSGNSTIRKVTPTGVVTTLAGLAVTPGANDGTNSAARFFKPQGVAVDSAGNLYVADTLNNTIRKVTTAGVVTTLAGLAGTPGTNDGTGSAARFFKPQGVAVDSAGNVYVADSANDTIREITPTGVVTTLAGLAGTSGANDGTNSAAQFYNPCGIAVDSATNLYVADTYNDTIRKITPVGTNWVVTTFAGKVELEGFGDGTGTNAQFNQPMGIAISAKGYIYVADTWNQEIRRMTPDGVVSTIAGAAECYCSVDGNGNDARFYSPWGVALDSAGNVYVADTFNDTIRQVTSAGVVSTIAGLAGSYGGADGVGNDARFYSPEGVAVDSTGNVYVADTYNYTIRQINWEGLVSTIAGMPGVTGSADGTNGAAQFNQPIGIAVDSAGNVYVADYGNNTIREITPVGTNWVVSTIAGMLGSYGSADGAGSTARFYFPYGVAVDSATNLYVADLGNNTIREITPVGTNWVVSTIAGVAGNSGSTDGVGTNASFNSPGAVAVDSSGNVYVAEFYTIRKITPVGTNWMVSTIGGLAHTWGSADGAGSAARFFLPRGVAADNAGNVYVADTDDSTIRKGVFTAYMATNPVPYTQPAMNSSLTVTLLPPEANGQWRFPWEVAWRTNGQTASNLVAGEYPIEFRAIPGWIVIPLTAPVGLTNNQSASITNQYYPTLSTVDTNNGGTLTVTLGPNPPGGAGWGFLGNSPPWYPSGYSTNLVAGTYLIDFAPVSGRVTPPNLSVQVQAGLTTLLDENYLLAQSAPGGALLPTPVPPANISDLTDYPFGFNGRLESDVGYGSGVAVQAYVVLTAAHLVFNDQTLSYVSQAYWYFQEEANVFEPDPLLSRGSYVLSGYAAQRTNDLRVYAPDTSTPQSRNLDVAALYFLSPVAGPGGGYGGYLPSDASPNPWLTGTSLKMLVGYPVDGSQFENTTIVPGEMYQTDPQPYPLTLATDPVADQQVYTASWFLSYPGNSGGPLYVQYNGYYYPAGVYLGSLYNGTTPYASAVRAIDSDVVNLITNAAILGDTGTNYAGGGVITFIPNQAISTNHPGYLQFQLAPPAAVLAGAAWELQGDPAWSTATNYVRAVTTTNTIVVEFKLTAGWNLPTNQTVTVEPGQTATPTAFYTVTNPVLVAGYSVGLGITGTTGTVYQLERRTNLTSGSWLPVSTNTILTTGFNLLLPQPATNGNAFFYRAVWLGY